MQAKNQVEFQILGETEDFLAVDKPAGLLTHPTKPHGPRTLWHELCALLGYELAIGGQVSLVNRLDRETSGVLLVAKTAEAARAAGIAMQNGRIEKEYLALVFGWPDWNEMIIDAAIARRGEVAQSEVWVERVVNPRGARAITRVQVDERLELPGHRRFSLLKAWPETGRTHQVRVHLSHIGFPILGIRSTREEVAIISILSCMGGQRRWNRKFGCRATPCIPPVSASTSAGKSWNGAVRCLSIWRGSLRCRKPALTLLALSALPFDDDGFSDSFCDTLTASAVLHIAIILRI